MLDFDVVWERDTNWNSYPVLGNGTVDPRGVGLRDVVCEYNTNYPVINIVPVIIKMSTDN